MQSHKRYTSRLIGISASILAFASIAAVDTRTSNPAEGQTVAARNGVRLRLDRSERKLVLENGGRVVRTFNVAVGQPSHPTPTGDFTIRRMIWNPTWVPPDNDWAKDATAKSPNDPNNPMESVKIYFREPSYYIHGTNNPESIGEAASHGCVRMVPDEAAELGEYLMQHGGEPRSDQWFRKVVNADHTTEISLESSIPLTISP